MDDDLDNPLDDELLRELGLEPKAKPPPPPPSHPPPPQPKPAAPKAQAPVPPRPPVSQAPASSKGGTAESLARDMPVQVVAVLGKKTMSLAEVIALKEGELVDFQKLPQELVDLVANGKLVARGELVVIEGKLGIQIKQLVG